jgi:guanine nucleotide-binding protein alpha-1 subunit
MGRTLASPLDDPNDPLALALRPPPNETAQERIAREKAEAEARRISDEIDEELKKEREGMKKGTKRPVKLLLLGQSESGKTATLKSESPSCTYSAVDSSSTQTFS